MTQEVKNKEIVRIKTYFISVYIITATILFSISNVLPLLINYILGLIIITLMFSFIVTKDKFIFIYITFPILFIESSLSPWSNSFVQYFHNGIFEYVSLYHLFSFICLLQVIFVKPLIENKIRIDMNFLILLLLLILALISVSFAFVSNTQRLFQSLFFIQNLAVVIFLYNWFSEWSITQLQKFLKIIFLLIIILLCINPLLDRHLITHSFYFLLSISAPLIIYTFMYMKTNLVFKLILISLILVFVLDHGIGQASSTTTTIVVYYSFIMTFLFVLNKNFFNFIVLCSIIIFFLVQLSFIYFAFFPDYLIQEYELIYNERKQQGVGFIDQIRFKLFADRSALWMGVYNYLNEQTFTENLIIASGQGFNPIFHGTFSSAERAYSSWTVGAHQLILELIMNLGTFGATIFFIFLTKILLMIRKVSSNFNDSKYFSFLLISVLSYLLFPSFVGNFMLQSSSFLFWLSLALLMSFIKISSEQSNDKKNN